MIVYPSYTTLLFICPKCNTQYSFLSVEISKKGKKWYCGCGQDMLLSRKKRVYNENSTGQPPKLVQSPNQLVLECVSILVGMGFSKKDMKKEVENIVVEGYSSKEEIIKRVLAKVKI